MFKKMMTIFSRDLRVNLRDFLSLYIILVPILFGIGINLLTPGINDTTVNLALIEGENPAQVEYFKDFAKVELLKDAEAVKARVMNRDNIIGILPDGDDYYILHQGNEPESVVDFGKGILTLFETGSNLEETNAEIVELGRTTPPLKKMLVNICILFTSVLGGMLISINIVEEKADNTVSAINVTPISRTAYFIGKSLIGLAVPLLGSLAMLWITGFRDANFGQVLLIVFASTLISLIIGFIEGIRNDDIMSAAGSIKMMFLPLAASVAAIEALGDKWQKFFYWSPFYWAYKGNDAVLSQTSTWPQILMYTGIVLALCSVVYIFIAPKIRKGLEQ